jgi:hypothetical protein
MQRANPFADLDDLEPKKSKKLDADVAKKISQIAEQNGFPSRPAKAAPKKETPQEPAIEPPMARRGRRFRTGRTEQINIRARPEDVETLYRLGDRLNVPFGELLRLALESLEKELDR